MDSQTLGGLAQIPGCQRPGMFDPGQGERHRLGPTTLVEIPGLFERIQGFKAEAFPGPVDRQVLMDLLFPRGQMEQQQGQILDDLILHPHLLAGGNACEPS